MKQILRVLFFVFFTLCVQCEVKGVITVMSSGFEDGEDVSGWQMVHDSNYAGAWSIGGVQRCSGLKGLYVSKDGGVSSAFAVGDSAFCVAYHSVTLPAGQRCVVSFQGKRGANSNFEVCVVPDSAWSVSSMDWAAEPAWMATHAQLSVTSVIWNNYSFEMVGTGQPQHIAMVWKSDGAAAMNYGGGVDNFYIREAMPDDYVNGFESAGELADWTLYNNRNKSTGWCIGGAESLHGTGALYLSADSGATVGYENNTLLVLASMDVMLLPQESYRISFDWKCEGEDDNDYLEVCWLTDSIYIGAAPSTNVVPSWHSYSVKSFNGSSQLKGSKGWRSSEFTVRGDGNPGRLIFMWRNNGTVLKQGPVIDNVQVLRTQCVGSWDVKVERDANCGLQLSVGNLVGEYDLEYRCVSGRDTSWVRRNGLQGDVALGYVDDGDYVLRVRRVCGNNGLGHSVWHTTNYSMNCGELFDFTALTDTTVARCYYGRVNGNEYEGYEDNGQNSNVSTHVVCREPGTAPWASALSVLPPEGGVSVRLGTPAISQQYSVVYSFKGSALYPILELNLATVMDFAGHVPGDTLNWSEPFMRVQVIDAVNGDVYDSLRIQYGSPQLQWNGSGVKWSDWTKLAIDLSAYAGMDLEFKITAADCHYSGHFGFIYYSIRFDKGVPQVFYCDEDRGDEVCMPEGYRYEWSSVANPSVVVSRDRCFEGVPGDSGLYQCKVVDLFEKERTLPVSFENYVPVAALSHEVMPGECSNRLRFRNNSRLQGSVSGSDIDACGRAVLMVNGVQYLLNDTLTLDFGSDSLLLDVKLVALGAGARCNDTVSRLIYLSELSSYNLVVNDTILFGDTYRIYTSDVLIPVGVHHYDLVCKSVSGCDSLVDLTLTVLNVHYVQDTVCHGDVYWYNGAMQVMPVGVHHEDLILTDVLGGDSVVRLSLVVLPLKEQYDTLYILTTDLPYAYGDVVFDEQTPMGVSDYVYSKGVEGGCERRYLHLNVSDVSAVCHVWVDGVRYYPNPLDVGMRLLVEFSDVFSVCAQLELFDVSGVKVYSERVCQARAELYLDVVPGVYVIRLTGDSGGMFTGKLIVQ